MRSKDPLLMDRIKAYVDSYALENGGKTPSTRAIGVRFGVSHVCAYNYLRTMDELGMLSYEKGIIRTNLTDKIERKNDLSPSFSGAIPAGLPDEVEARVEEYVSIPSIFTDNKKGQFYIMKVTGESMVDADIEDGDLVIIQKDKPARTGSIVAALVHGTSSTLKRLLSDERGQYLWAENNSWTDERRNYGRDFAIQGVAVKIVKTPK